MGEKRLPGQSLVHTSDVDDLVERVTAIMSSHTLAPAGAGAFTADVSGFRTPGLSLLEFDYGTAVRLAADPLPGYVAVCLPLTGSMTARHQGRRLDAVAGGAALVGTPASELVMDWDETLRLLVVRVDLGALRSLASRLVTDQPDELDLAFDPAMDDPQVVAAVLGQAQLMEQVLGRVGPDAVNPVAAAQLSEQVMFTLLLGQPHSSTEALCGRPARPHRSTVADAAELMRSHAGEPLTIEGVARTVGLSVRALHAGFCREFDRSPKQFLQHVRLERARADLVVADPVGGLRVIDVAYRWGFSHPGRFATTYRHRYGEPPATTLGRALP